MPRIRLSSDRIHVGSGFSVSFQRTLRVPDTGEFPLPPGLGAFPVVRIKTRRAALPRQWKAAPEFAVPLHQYEALWLGFSGRDRKPNALKIASGGVNVVSGTVWQHGLHETPQDYIVVPDQPWLDGFNAGGSYIRQFVAAPLGTGVTAEEQLTGRGAAGGLQFELYQPKADRIRTRLKERSDDAEVARLPQMGLAAGGRIRQKVYQDPYGIDVWDRRRGVSRLVVHLLNTEQFREHTGQEPPPSPVSAEIYAQSGLPWFDLYDEEATSVSASPALAGLKGVTITDTEPPARSLDPATLPVRRLRTTSRARSDGRRKGAS